jgi:C4-dicarboxylate transporter DctQ subunit
MLVRIDNLLAKGEKFLVVLLFTVLIGLIVFSIFARDVIGMPTYLASETSPALVLWLSLLGATLALKSGRHIRIELLLRFCPPAARHLAGIISALFGLLAMGTLAVAAVAFCTNEMAIFGGKGLFAVVFPIFFSLCAFRFLCAALACLSRLIDQDRGGNPNHKAALR